MPESEDFLAQALIALTEAKIALEKEMPRTAAREAYSACLAAARAIVYEIRHLSPKTYKGIHTTIATVLRERSDLPQNLITVLGQGYEAKQRIDYGPPIQIDLVEAARRVDDAEKVLTAATNLVRAK